MELLQKYWYIALGALVLLFVVGRNNNGGGTLTQLRQGTDTVAMAQIASAEREADEARKFGLAGNLLQYNFNQQELQVNTELAKLNIANQIDLAKLSLEAQETAAANSYQLAALQASSNQYANDLAYQLARYTAQRQSSAINTQNWLGAITSGVQTLLPYLFGRQTSGGSINIPRTPNTFPNSVDWGSWGGVR